ncbi:MAG: tetratricopeptide repeat protein, partial [Actinobacteria bacterium]|nr:tetratricopeptide repeat protein [Actinomycetota bacterium]
YHNLGLLYFSQEDYDNAIEQWNKILEIEPNFLNKYIVLNNLGIVYQKKEMPDKALEYFVQALQLAPEGSPIIEEIEKELYNIYKSKLEN